MKKITLKISVFLLFALFALQVQGQALWTENGVYKISTSGLSPNLYMTIDLTAGGGLGPFVEWREELTGNDESQLFTIIDHRTPASSGLMEITATVTYDGNPTPLTLCAADDSSYPNLTLTVRPGAPKEVLPYNDPSYDATTADYSGLDQFQRRQTKVDENGLYSSTGAVPPTGQNNALFLRTISGTASRYGVTPSAVGDLVKFDKGGIDVIQFHLVQSLSTVEFDTSSIFISNPVKDELTIKGLNQSIKQISVYDLLGKQVISSNLSDDTISTKLDVSKLTKGLYIVKLQGENGASFTKKIVKE